MKRDEGCMSRLERDDTAHAASDCDRVWATQTDDRESSASSWCR